MKRILLGMIATTLSLSSAHADQSQVRADIQPHVLDRNDCNTVIQRGAPNCQPGNNWNKSLIHRLQASEFELKSLKDELTDFQSAASVPPKFRLVSECEQVQLAIRKKGVLGFFEIAHAYPEVVTKCVNAPEIKAW